ncbi:bifunctional adenosylcobinamide kinase/adenosylcobinamide-phosphate guanylyltransferase [Sulfitobacter delicatus]|jgi:adenosylcobinamide kinase / adenosylcobinamide-phosphate guanylyltransferase|uniref:Bifunctional adenosylcobalamin biosynthesis protein n=1 Tax=Sulfitobacter delicatus TaxID=218672 RepID=A0A1G7YNP0_9RHOB|nr:bifunctional adenosylcobinamide kinase/adenosylcobinamide-phosphate guanylyltransferase [Sulfitobacter delicatus]SDG98067.1 adenosylcobinamide kinase /adenosylcobinamide-phosphate guanylyltransferase [Sulfitobacter delicatus]
MLPRNTFALGGAASGKSQWAEDVANSCGLRKTYLATGRIWDGEVQERVNIHRARRDAGWQTVECPLDLAEPLSRLTSGEIVLIDCATMWLSNHLMDGNDLGQAQTDLLQALRSCAAPWIIVSNEVGQGIVPDNAMARQFREAQGRLNIALAGEADTVVQVIAGLPQVLKGQLP